MKRHDLIVIGAGPGGYVAAIRAAQLGMNVACVDAHKALGGTCLRIGCIPSKALLESSARYRAATSQLAEHGINVGEVTLDLPAMLKRKDRIVKTHTGGVASLMKKHDITTYHGYAQLAGDRRVRITGEGDDDIELQAEHIIIATGSRPADLPGVERDDDRIGTSTQALAYDQVPERLVVIGGGYIGVEMGSVWQRLGAQVTVLETLDRILPNVDEDIASEAKRLFEKQGLTFRLGSRVTGARIEDDHCVVEVEDAEPIECDRVLVAVGRAPVTDGLGLDEVGVETDEKGFVKVDDAFATSVEGVYAIGDVIGGMMLAHKASAEAVACVEMLADGTGQVNYGAIPAVIFTEPEIAWVGPTEAQLESQETDYVKGEFSFRASGRARALGRLDGRVKLLCDADTDRLLAVHMIGPHVGELIAQAVAAHEIGASSEDLARL